jgi:hypothetical protein
MATLTNLMIGTWPSIHRGDFFHGSVLGGRLLRDSQRMSTAARGRIIKSYLLCRKLLG